MKKSMVRLCLWLFLTAGLFFSFWKILDGWKAEKDYGEAARIVGLSDVDDSLPVQTNPPEVQEESKVEDLENSAIEALPEEAAILADLDLEALRKVNDDVIGWIEIPGTKLSYPLVQGEDNEYYLNRNWKKEYSASGSIFLESTNRTDLSDFHMIIYGHRMRDNTMFGILKYYKDLDFWQEHPNIYLVAGDDICRYAIFSAYETSVNGMVYRLNLEKSSLEDEFLRFCMDSSVLDTGIIPVPGAQILTLSTCTGYGHATRWVVQGYLARKYPKAAKDL